MLDRIMDRRSSPRGDLDEDRATASAVSAARGADSSDGESDLIELLEILGGLGRDDRERLLDLARRLAAGE